MATCHQALANTYSCTAFFINSNGYIATAAHCTKEAINFKVLVAGQYHNAYLVDADIEADIAILKVEGITNNTYYKINTPAQQPKSDISPDYLMVGFPDPFVFHYRQVSNYGRLVRTELTDKWGWAYYFDMVTYGGDSGAPVIDKQNRVLGIVVGGYRLKKYDYRGGDDATVIFTQHLIDLALKNGVKIDVDNTLTSDFTIKQLLDFSRTNVIELFEDDGK